MNVTVNSEPRTVEESTTVAALLEQLGLTDYHGIAVELDGKFVERGAYASTLLAPHSHIEIVRFVGGG